MTALNVKPTNSRRSSRTDAPIRPAMTATDALTFEAVSSKSAMQVTEAIEARTAEGKHVGCTCQPYEDVFTFNRWKAIGFGVRKGETALRIASYVPVADKKGAENGPTPKDGETGDGRKHLIPKTLFLFCRCQVQSIEETPSA